MVNDASTVSNSTTEITLPDNDLLDDLHFDARPLPLLSKGGRDEKERSSLELYLLEARFVKSIGSKHRGEWVGDVWRLKDIPWALSALRP